VANAQLKILRNDMGPTKGLAKVLDPYKHTVIHYTCEMTEVLFGFTPEWNTLLYYLFNP